MSNTVLSFMDFFWIWFVVVMMNGGSTYLGKSGSLDKDELEALRQQLAALTEEIRSLKRDAGSS